MKKTTNGQRLQHVLSSKKEFVESYVTKSGQVKNRYITIPGTRVVKTIVHLK